MPSNIEIKANLKNRASVELIAAQLSDTEPELIQQEDVFFRCDGARLKLRILGRDRGELIRYERADMANARCSRYTIARTSDPQNLLDILTKTLGTTGLVKKMRTLYLIGQTRVHLDQVQNLGDFLELEVVLRPGQDESEGRSIADALLARFGIDKQQLLAEAYVDLLARHLHTVESP
ncbi:MAG: class IV adenylate cyclase [Terriglobales bacterium]|jgi:predicted adenylyl cyclase CyaB